VGFASREYLRSPLAQQDVIKGLRFSLLVPILRLKIRSPTATGQLFGI
jgi:hypothetical protein